MELAPKQRLASGFDLKMIAIIAMTVDHVAWTFFSFSTYPLAATIMHTIGKLTFPIMAFFIVEGYTHTRSVARYMGRMALFALISLLPFVMLFGSWSYHNVLFTMLFGLCAIQVYEKPLPDAWMRRLEAGGLPQAVKAILPAASRVVCLLALEAVSQFTDWSLMGVPLILLMYVMRHKGRMMRTLIPIAIVLGFAFVIGALQFIGMYAERGIVNAGDLLNLGTMLGMLLTVPLLARYRGVRGRNLKYLFYVYYPAHMMVLVLLRTLITGG